MMQIFQIIILIFSAIVHEYMHGWMALQLGDPTAEREGRLTLNPLPHIDLYGSIILPALMILSGIGFVFGYAKPVPYNPYNLKNQKWGPALVAVAGPLGNLVLAIMFGLTLRYLSAYPIAALANETTFGLLMAVVIINIALMIFNLLPIPPLDGSKVLLALLPPRYEKYFYNLERYGILLVLLFVFFGYSLIMPVIIGLFSLITGLR